MITVFDNLPDVYFLAIWIAYTQIWQETKFRNVVFALGYELQRFLEGEILCGE